MNQVYEIPSSLKELFTNGPVSYKIVNHEFEMDNNEAMKHFLESVEIYEESIEIDDGTQVILKHPDFDYLAVVDSRGLGDFYSHGYDISFVKKVNNDYVDYNP